MKPLLIGIIGVLVLMLAIWIVAGNFMPTTPLHWALVFLVFVIPPIGAWWLVYMSIRYEHHTFPIILLALLPYGFVWYYFERERPRRKYQ